MYTREVKHKRLPRGFVNEAQMNTYSDVRKYRKLKSPSRIVWQGTSAHVYVQLSESHEIHVCMCVCVCACVRLCVRTSEMMQQAKFAVFWFSLPRSLSVLRQSSVSTYCYFTKQGNNRKFHEQVWSVKVDDRGNLDALFYFHGKPAGAGDCRRVATNDAGDVMVVGSDGLASAQVTTPLGTHTKNHFFSTSVRINIST